MSQYESSTSVPVPSFTAQGLSIPSESEILTGVIADINNAFAGSLTFYDSSGNLLVSRPHVQLASTVSAIINDCYGVMAQFYRGVDPAYATGALQDAIGQIYFLERKSATATVVACVCSGIAGTVIPAGATAQDSAGYTYACVSGGTIGTDGTVSLDFQNTTAGAIACAAGTLSIIASGVSGWTAITNPADGVIGSDEESATEFEERRKESVALNAVGTVDAILANVRSVDGVIDAYVYANDTAADATVGSVDIPAHCIYVCVSGGSDTDVATAIWKKKPPGIPTTGSTTVTVTDSENGYATPPSYSISFTRATAQAVHVQVTLSASVLTPQDYVSQIQSAVLSAFENAAETKIAGTVYASIFYSAVAALGSWVRIVNIKVSLDGATWADDVTASAAQIPTLSSADITVASS